MITTLLDPKNDIAFKKIFGSEKNKDILIRFINDMLAFRGGDPVVDVTIQNNVLPGNTVVEKTGILDVLCEDSLGHFYIVETLVCNSLSHLPTYHPWSNINTQSRDDTLQVAGEEHFGKRAEYYTAKKYGNQLRSGTRYGELKPVVFIAILSFGLFPDDIPYKSDHLILEENTFKHLLKSQSFVFLELPKFAKKRSDINENSTMIEKWACFFKHAARMGPLDWEKMTAGDIVMRRAYCELSSAYWSSEELAAYEDKEKRAVDYNSILYDREAKGIAKGRAEGLVEGEAKGLVEGEVKAKIETAKNLLAMGFSVEDISKATGLSVSEINDTCK